MRQTSQSHGKKSDKRTNMGYVEARGSMYKKSIILLKNRPVAQIIKGFLTTRKKELENESTLLNDFDEVKKDIHSNKNTVNLRKHFGNFIMKNGMPYLMVMDYRADLGLPQEIDPDQLKIFNTFLISFCILAHTPSHEKQTINLILLLDPNETKFKEEAIKNPALLFEGLKTHDERANIFINNIAKNPEKAKQFINLHTLTYQEGQNIHAELKKLETLIATIDSRLSKIKQDNMQKNASKILTENLEPARIICRPTGEKIVCNGEIKDITEEEKTKYFGSYVNVEGAVTQSTAPVVQKRIIDTINSVSRIKPITKDSKLVFLIPDSSVIDSSFATSMGIFFTNLKTKYPGVMIDLGEVNLEKVKTSPGLIVVKGLLVKAL